MGVVRQLDWITGCELSCFGVRRCVRWRTTLGVLLQFNRCGLNPNCESAIRPKLASAGVAHGL